jgi:hypothetical protein
LRAASSKAQPLYLCIPHAVCCLSYSFSCGYSETTASNSEGYWPTCSACFTYLSKLTAFTWNTGPLMTLTFWTCQTPTFTPRVKHGFP